ncbi:hypothetical protein RESH_03474 [Rhodopirellula europaea SH398]|uniref:Uncharacterized protein n=1 Tax=Rhodopirellula europaea SH398 TaxID=1263868 RepID=M5S2L3_9BACT|nr:hypothetical protein RESH_03474 [Rhodopirellula europaea SH398]
MSDAARQTRRQKPRKSPTLMATIAPSQAVKLTLKHSALIKF